jgi:predicted amidohydrolase YtcJ
MPMKRRSVLAGLAALPAARVAAAADRPVTVIEAAKIVTMEPAQPTARFVAIADGTILGVADRLSDLSAWTAGRAVHHDRSLAGKVLLPGFIEPHLHPMQAAVMLNIPFAAPDDWQLPSGSFPGVRTPAAWRGRVRELLAGSKADPFICWGYHELFHGPLDRAALDAIAPGRAMIIWQRSFHEVILNSAALRAWGLGDQAAFDAALKQAKADPAHGSFERGLFSETALPIALAKMRPAILAPAKIQAGMTALQQLFLAHGITTASDMATGIFAGFDTEARLIRSAFERGDNPSRIMLMLIASTVPESDDPAALIDTIAASYAGPHVRVDRRVKLLADGAFFAQNMRMGPPGYSDGHQGKWITPPDVLVAQARRFWDKGFSLHIHVNGDEGLDVVLAAIEALPVRRAQSVTLEHLGYSTEAQNRRIARLGLMVSAQPNYIRVLGDAYAATGLGPDRAAAMNRLGSLERLGVPLGLHSDFNMAPIDPLYLAWIAANRITLDGSVKAPAERLSLDKALRAITIEAAQVIGMDALVGSIAAGKRADFAVLDRDPYAVGAAGLRGLRVEGVVFEGRLFPRR